MELLLFRVIVGMKGDDIYKAPTSPQQLVGAQQISHGSPHTQSPTPLLKAPPKTDLLDFGPSECLALRPRIFVPHSRFSDSNLSTED